MSSKGGTWGGKPEKASKERKKRSSRKIIRARRKWPRGFSRIRGRVEGKGFEQGVGIDAANKTWRMKGGSL